LSGKIFELLVVNGSDSNSIKQIEACFKFKKHNKFVYSTFVECYFKMAELSFQYFFSVFCNLFDVFIQDISYFIFSSGSCYLFQPIGSWFLILLSENFYLIPAF